MRLPIRNLPRAVIENCQCATDNRTDLKTCTLLTILVHALQKRAHRSLPLMHKSASLRIRTEQLTLKTIQSQLILAFSIAILVPAIITIYVGMRVISDQIITRGDENNLRPELGARNLPEQDFRDPQHHPPYCRSQTRARCGDKPGP